MDELRRLMDLGFVVYSNSGFYTVRKVATPADDRTAEGANFATFEKAVEFAASFTAQPPETEWSVMIRFNKGLGPQHREIPNVRAATYEDALAEARRLGREYMDADPELKKVPLSEARVTPTTCR